MKATFLAPLSTAWKRCCLAFLCFFIPAISFWRLASMSSQSSWNRSKQKSGLKPYSKPQNMVSIFYSPIVTHHIKRYLKVSIACIEIDTGKVSWQNMMKIMRIKLIIKVAFSVIFSRVSLQILQTMCHFKAWGLFLEKKLKSQFCQRNP